MIILGTPRLSKCRDCGERMEVDYMTLCDFGANDIDYICDECRDKIQATYNRIDKHVGKAALYVAFACAMLLFLSELGTAIERTKIGNVVQSQMFTIPVAGGR